ncbi:MAG: transglutaminase domain-containing protein, partial [Candidatus Humimicrobiaceae bacterium]
KHVKAFLFLFCSFFLVFAMVSCCFVPNAFGSLENEPVIPSLPSEEIILNADFDIFQIGSSEGYLEKNIPVVFKYKNYENSDFEEIKYRWKIDGEIDVEGTEIDYTFNRSGNHSVSLTVSQGNLYAVKSKSFSICESVNKFLIINTHQSEVRIKYLIENKGPGIINDIQCRIETPYDFSPFQSVIELSSDNEKKEITDNNGNIIYRFKLDDIEEGFTSKASVDCIININEFIIKAPDLLFQNYDSDDIDVKKYTKSEKYIDSDSNKIIDAAYTITAGEQDPFKKAELLYDFVVKRLDYDYERMEEKNFEISDASDILNWDKGVCTDYSLLFASLCRASGIPCKFIVGLSLRSISSEQNGISSMSHAWNEIKLPGYGWFPVDITSENPFMGANVNLNLKTFEGTGSLYRSTKIDGYPSNALGFFYYYPDSENIPKVITENIFSVQDINDRHQVLN